MDDHYELIEGGRVSLREVSEVLKAITDREAMTLLGTGALDELLQAILDPRDMANFSTIEEFLFANRYRAELLARLRHVITSNYSFPIQDEGNEEAFVSPMFAQWFDDGILYLVGKSRFGGYLALFRDGVTSYGVAARDVRRGETMGPEHFTFIPADEARRLHDELVQAASTALDKPLEEMRLLISARENDESKYQELLQRYPWVLGAQYIRIQRHTKLDDENIPDFTGSRVHDHGRDVIEIKPPFTSLFKVEGEFNANFNEYWNQAERYLDFARMHKDYLLTAKGLRFENPKCYLVMGFDLTDNQIAMIRRKERMNPSITILTFNDLLTFVASTIQLVRNLKDKDGLEPEAT